MGFQGHERDTGWEVSALVPVTQGWPTHPAVAAPLQVEAYVGIVSILFTLGLALSVFGFLATLIW